MDAESALKEFENDRDLLKDTLNEFIRNAESQLVVIRKAAEAGDWKIIAGQSHSLAGGAANLRAAVLADKARLLESQARTQTLHHYSPLIDDLQDEFDRFKDFCSTRFDL